MSLEDVAKRANVSSATVSRVLNGSAGVRDATRERVLRAAGELNYHLNLHASTLAGKRSNTFGMIVSNLENPFFLDVFRSAEAHARTHHHNWILANTGYDPETLAKCVHHMLGWRVAGLALVVSEVDSAIVQQISDLKIPVAFYDAQHASSAFNVSLDYATGLDMVVRHLQELGHKRIGFVSRQSSQGSSTLRERTFRETAAALSAHGDWRIVENDDSPVGGRKAVQELLYSGFGATAILCVNDFMALGVLAELREQGLRVPIDISVTGMDDIGLAQIANPELTTVAFSREQIGYLIAEALLSGDSDKFQSGNTVIAPELIVRQTTGPASVTVFQKPVSAKA